MCYFLEYNAYAHFNNTIQYNLDFFWDCFAAIDYVENYWGSRLMLTALHYSEDEEGRPKANSEKLLYWTGWQNTWELLCGNIN